MFGIVHLNGSTYQLVDLKRGGGAIIRQVYLIYLKLKT